MFHDRIETACQRVIKAGVSSEKRGWGETLFRDNVTFYINSMRKVLPTARAALFKVCKVIEVF